MILFSQSQHKQGLSELALEDGGGGETRAPRPGRWNSGQEMGEAEAPLVRYHPMRVAGIAAEEEPASGGAGGEDLGAGCGSGEGLRVPSAQALRTEEESVCGYGNHSRKS